MFISPESLTVAFVIVNATPSCCDHFVVSGFVISAHALDFFVLQLYLSVQQEVGAFCVEPLAVFPLSPSTFH